MLSGIIGHPVSHTWSPYIYSSLERIYGVEIDYLPVDIRPEFVPTFFRRASRNFSWFNVTVPHKVSSMRFLHEIDSSARMSGAVNLVTVNDGRLIGYNTDLQGFTDMCRKHALDLRGKRVAVAGTGGAARAVTAALVGSDVTLISRSPGDSEWGARAVDYGTARSMEFDVLINCTPVGMWPNSASDPFEGFRLHAGIVGIDLVYNPVDTQFLRRVRNAGGTAVSGLWMLIYQALEAFRIVTGIRAAEGLADTLFRRLSALG
ncbi:shikimate dehydrogenase [Thermogymnomonas acidicola]|uniref:Shikimate dehydrogenase n=1 Tax=Thermogymnomonas acidicola TaxID=399579 RepID=A0AA37BQT8_9ARCH|nr:shikimate dehydrogenase [Thermogymnomonas acidicola]GGM70676.1 shikimate dehydrogenase [Thermogymnomonas acidicola]